jgi:hypothetical protein
VIHEVFTAMPKKPEDVRTTFPPDLAEKLLQQVKRAGRPERDLAAVMRWLAYEWLDKGGTRAVLARLDEINERLGALEARVAALIDQPEGGSGEGPGEGPQTRRSHGLDDLTRRILDHLASIADEHGVTPQVSAQAIGQSVALGQEKPTMKRVLSRIRKLIDMNMISIEEESGGQGGRRYRVSAGWSRD